MLNLSILKINPDKYPIYLFETDTSGEKTYEEFYTEKEDYNVNKYQSLGFINSEDINLSFEDVITDFENIFSSALVDKKNIINIIKKYVTDFAHIETGKKS